jgi:hypothetical protein
MSINAQASTDVRKGRGVRMEEGMRKEGVQGDGRDKGMERV